VPDGLPGGQYTIEIQAKNPPVKTVSEPTRFTVVGEGKEPDFEPI